MQHLVDGQCDIMGGGGINVTILLNFGQRSSLVPSRPSVAVSRVWMTEHKTKLWYDLS